VLHWIRLVSAGNNNKNLSTNQQLISTGRDRTSHQKEIMDRYNPTIENKNHLHKKNVGLFISIFTFPRFTVLIIRSGLHIKASTSDSSHQSLEHSENSTILTCYR
jgi:hypothetical protein